MTTISSVVVVTVTTCHSWLIVLLPSLDTNEESLPVALRDSTLLAPRKNLLSLPSCLFVLPTEADFVARDSSLLAGFSEILGRGFGGRCVKSSVTAVSVVPSLVLRIPLADL